MPKMDSPSCFGRLLDWDRGGFCSIRPEGGSYTTQREYLGHTMVLQTTFTTPTGEARVMDCFAMREGGRHHPHHQLLRVVEGIRGQVTFKFDVSPRFDHGEIKPWLRHQSDKVYAAIGGQNGMLISSDAELSVENSHDLTATATVRAEDRVRLVLQWWRPERLDGGRATVSSSTEVDERLRETLEWWLRWSEQAHFDGVDAPSVMRSALVIKAMTYAPTGAIIAASTTSLPEWIGGERNWDYRYSWIRDSFLSVNSLADIGCSKEADGFRRFIQRSAAGSARDLKIVYGIQGDRRLPELEPR